MIRNYKFLLTELLFLLMYIFGNKNAPLLPRFLVLSISCDPLVLFFHLFVSSNSNHLDGTALFSGCIITLSRSSVYNKRFISIKKRIILLHFYYYDVNNVMLVQRHITYHQLYLNISFNLCNFWVLLWFSKMITIGLLHTYIIYVYNMK